MKFNIIHSSLGKARGLMFSRKKNLIFIFKKSKKISLHMFFVFFPIDVLFLDKDKKIIEIKKNFRPFTTYTSKNEVMYVVELSEKNSYKIGQKFKY